MATWQALAGLGVSKADVSIALDALAGEIEEAEAQAVDAGHDVDMPGAGAHIPACMYPRRAGSMPVLIGLVSSSGFCMAEC